MVAVDVGEDGMDVAVANFIHTAVVKAEAADTKTTSVDEVEVADTKLILTVVIPHNHKTRPENQYAIVVDWEIIGLRIVGLLNNLLTFIKRVLKRKTQKPIRSRQIKKEILIMSKMTN